MEYYTNEGTWWLPGHQRSVITGTLSFSVSGLDLLVTGWFPTAGARQRQSEQNYGPSDWEKLPVIHGITTPDRRPVTLLQVEGAPHVGPSGVKIENNYIAGIALGGIHAVRDSFTEVRFTFDYLNAWAQPPSLTSNMASSATIAVQFEDIELASTRIGRGKVQLIASAIGTAGGRAVHLEQQVMFVARVPAASASSIIDDWVRPFQDFLTIALGRSVRLTSLFLRPAYGHRSFAEASFGAVQIGPGPTPKWGSAMSYSASTLVTLTDSPEPFGRLLKRWFKVRSEYRDVLILLLAPYYAPFIFSDHRYSSVFQSAEALANILFDTKEMPTGAHNARVAAIIDAATAAGVSDKHVSWAHRVLQSRNDRTLADRITELVNSVGLIGTDVVAACPSFATLVARARTGVSHPAKGRLSNIERYWLGDVLGWIVRARILVESGIPLSEIEKRVLKSAPFRHALEQIRNSLVAG